MGTTAFVGYRFKDKVQGFSMSGNGYYEAAGLDVLDKYEQLSKIEMTDFFTNRVKFYDYDAADEMLQTYIEDNLIDNMYEIWNINWKTDLIEIEDGKDMVMENSYSREYGYVFNLDDDTVEVYNQGEYDENKPDEPDHALKLTINRNNTLKVRELFDKSGEIQSRYDDADNYEELFLNS
jgi:hypothetical protein